MIEFQCRCRDRTFTPIIRNQEIWEYAESLVGDYKPSLLKQPGKLNGLHFIESYLGAAVDYQDIYYAENEKPIAGATIFNDDVIRVFNREGMCIDTIDVAANTIILDNSIMREGKEGYANFTVLHEGGHFTMHPAVYRRNANQISFFEKPKDGHSVVCCRKADIFGGEKALDPKKFTPLESREHQANVFAAFASMPRQTFVPLAKEFARDEGFDKDGILVENDWDSDIQIDSVVRKLMEVYGSSYTATKIHLKELGLLMNYHAYDDMKSQLKISL